MTETALTTINLKDTMTLGETLAKSGYFSDAKGAAQAVVKVLAGRELGFGPIASMTGVHIVQGKPTLGANLMGAAIKRTGKYNYRIVTLNEQQCEIAFYEDGEEVGRSTFSMADAQRAGLANKDNWKKYPRNMLFSRCLSNGARWYCPDVFSGVTPYTPEELGADIDGEASSIIEGQFTATEPEDTFDPDNPVFANYDDVYHRAAQHLGYDHFNHAKNALKQILDGDSNGLTHEGAWQLLKEHQAAKEAEDDA